MSRTKHFFLLPLFVAAVTGTLALSPSQAKTEEACEKHLKTTCNNCHTFQDACARLGKPATELRELLTRMDSNGAALSKEEIEAMVACMSEPSTAAKSACRK